MASTRFGKLSGASVAALLLLLAVLTGSFAPGAQAQDFFELTVANDLSNNVKCIIPPGFPLGSEQTFDVPFGQSRTERIDLFNALSELIVEVLGGPLAGSYATGGDGSQDGLLARVVFTTRPEVTIVGECFDYPGDNSGLELVVAFESDVETYDYDSLTFTICAPRM